MLDLAYSMSEEERENFYKSMPKIFLAVIIRESINDFIDTNIENYAGMTEKHWASDYLDYIEEKFAPLDKCIKYDILCEVFKKMLKHKAIDQNKQFLQIN